MQRRLSLGRRLHGLRPAHLGGGDPDQGRLAARCQRSALHRYAAPGWGSRTQVSLQPPPRELLTIISPAFGAKRVSPLPSHCCPQER